MQVFRSERKLMQWHRRIPEGAGFQVDTLCVTGDVPLMITSWRCCSGKPAHQSVCLKCWQSWKPPVVLRPEDVQTSPWWNHPPLPSKGSCWWKGIPRPAGRSMRHEAVPWASHHWFQHVCGRQILPQGTKEASAFCLQAFHGAAGISPYLSTAGKCWRVSNPKRNSTTGGQIPAIDLSKGQFWGIFCMVPQADPSRTEPQFSTVVPSSLSNTLFQKKL